ncbi:MAG TPA: ATP-binding cassette domain-containing protein [Nannocystaceae bacterium]|nr:ATP-binding cassette domain-containing protein [Nannocystaceae bacterium]
MVAVSVRQVTKSFGPTHVLRGVDVHVPAGGFAVLVGPSGCGKSTLLRLLAGLEEVTAGTIHFGEREVTHLEPRERDIAMVFQSYALYPNMTVRDNLAFGLRLRKTDEAVIRQRVAEAAAMLGLEALLDRLPKALSGGQRQRVAMGRAIVRRAGLFLFDEPLSNLDAALRAQVRVDIRRLHDHPYMPWKFTKGPTVDTPEHCVVKLGPTRNPPVILPSSAMPSWTHPPSVASEG